MSPKILVVSPSAEVSEIAREMAPKGFETVVVSDAEVTAALPGTEYMVCYPHVPMRDAFYKAVPKLKLVQLLERRLRQCRPRSRAARQGAALEQWRRERDLGLRARADADAHRLPQGDLAARQRVGRALARQRTGAAHVRALRQDARHHRLRHHRQEGGAARARLRHACAVFRHRAPVGGRGGPARRQVPPAARALALVRRRVAARAAERFDPPHDRRSKSSR